MAELRDLYQEVILEHAKAPRNYRELGAPAAKAEGHNPLCGDRCTVFINQQDGVIQDIAFQGNGCAISKASASMMTQALKGKTLPEAEAMFKDFHGMVTGQQKEGQGAEMGKLKVFAGVSEFPARVKCATLAWHTMMNALNHDEEAASTE